jgi:malate dehydrogenase (oxaloacetate-decarboxylating)
VSKDFELVRRDGRNVIRVSCRGRDVLNHPMINFGTAFTTEQREALGLTGLLPHAVISMDAQLKRVYRQFSDEPTNLGKYVYLNTMQDRNEHLFYRLLTEHIEEMLPIVYTPTIGKAIQSYSHWFHKPRGIYLDVDHPDSIRKELLTENKGADDIDLIVVTDSEGILGIGDQGVGGVAITIGKLSVYVAAAGIHPHRVLPVVLDTGTDNLDLLNDPAYLGVRHARVRGERYDQFVQRFVEEVQHCFPNALLHWEDFGAANAHRILARYRNEICTFNDDIQGTAGVVVAAVLSAISSARTRMSEQRIVIHGAGTAGVGIAQLLVDVMVSQGMSREEAMQQFWGLSSRGLLLEGGRLRDFQEPFARPVSEVADWQLDTPGHYGLADVVRNVKPTILIGASAQAGAFTESIVRQMASHVDRPIIMPLSNPTARAEATPADLLEWTDGRVLIATGSPFDPVEYGQTRYKIAQANNALIFPGIGLGVIVSRASRVTDTMIAAAAEAIASAVTDRRPGASLLPAMTQLRAISARVAVAVAETAEAEGLAGAPLTDPIQQVYDAMWQPDYPEIEVVQDGSA